MNEINIKNTLSNIKNFTNELDDFIRVDLAINPHECSDIKSLQSELNGKFREIIQNYSKDYMEFKLIYSLNRNYFYPPKLTNGFSIAVLHEKDLTMYSEISMNLEYKFDTCIKIINSLNFYRD